MKIEFNWKDFAKKLDASKEIVINVAEKDLKELGTRVFSKVVEYTPIGKPSIWSYNPPKGYIPGTLKKSWEIEIQPKEITIFNDQPYAQRVEYGWSTQAPNGMLRRALLSAPQILEQVAKEHKL